MLDAIIGYFAENSEYIVAFLWPTWRAIYLSALALALGVACGLLAALAIRSKIKPLSWPFAVYVWFIRGTPTLIQIYIVYFSLPQFGVVLTPEVAGVLALGVASGAYFAEIFRGGLSAIPSGQFESAAAMGMSPGQTMLRIIFPQIGRVVLPASTNEAIGLLKNSSLLSIITVYEITLHTQVVIAETFSPLDFYLISALIYLLMAGVISAVSKRVEARFAWSI